VIRTHNLKPSYQSSPALKYFYIPDDDNHDLAVKLLYLFRNVLKLRLWENPKLHLSMNVKINGFIKLTLKLTIKRLFYPIPSSCVLPTSVLLGNYFLAVRFDLALSYLFAAGLVLVFRFLALLPCCTSMLAIVWQCARCSKVYVGKFCVLVLNDLSVLLIFLQILRFVEMMMLFWAKLIFRFLLAVAWFLWNTPVRFSVQL